MTERERTPEPKDQRWSDFTRRLPEPQHQQLVLALGVGLREARKAAQVAQQDGTVTEARESLDLALSWLSQARQLLDATSPQEPTSDPGER